MTWGHVANAESRDRSASNSCPEATSPADHGPVISTEAWSRTLGDEHSISAALTEKRNRLIAKLATAKARINCKEASLIEADLRRVTHKLLQMELQQCKS